MKKNFLLLFLFCSSVTTFAQAPLNIISWDNKKEVPLIGKNTMQELSDLYQKRFSTNTREESYWLSYAFDLDSLNLFIAELSGSFLFPDSNVYVNFVDDQGLPIYDVPFVHSLGNVMNPLSFVFQIIDGVTLTETDPYYLDSMAVYYAYTRNTDASIVDTMMVSVFQAPDSSANLPEYFYSDDAASNNYWLNTYGDDTVSIPFIKYDKTNNRPSATGLQTFKIPLYEEDSTEFYIPKIFSTNNLAVAAGNVVACGISFKPGYTYEPFDTVDEDANIMFFASYEENGASTFPFYTPDDNNISSIIPTSVRYNINTSGYNGLYIPSYAYDAPYSFENHWLAYHITTELVGVGEIDDNKLNISLFPNPAANSIILNYSLNQSSDFQVKLMDLAGHVIQSITNQSEAQGKHQLVLSLQNLTAGTYVVSAHSGTDIPVIRKFIKSE